MISCFLCVQMLILSFRTQLGFGVASFDSLGNCKEQLFDNMPKPDMENEDRQSTRNYFPVLKCYCILKTMTE